MAHKSITLISVLAAWLLPVLPAQADTYQVLLANSENIRIGDRPAVAGMQFDDSDPIHWSSDQQALKVLNLSLNRVMVIAAKAFRATGSKTLADLLYQTKHLSTRDYGQTAAPADTVLYLLDTLRLKAGPHYGNGVIDQAVATVSGQRIVTPLQKTADRSAFILTRSIAGGKNPQTLYLDIVETDPEKDWQYCLYRRLRIDLLPLKAR